MGYFGSLENLEGVKVNEFDVILRLRINLIHKATNTFFLEKRDIFFSIIVSFSSNSSFLFYKAKVFIEIGILSS